MDMEEGRFHSLTLTFTYSQEQSNIWMSFCALEECHGGRPVFLQRAARCSLPRAHTERRFSVICDFLCYSQIFKTGLRMSAPAANKTLMSNTSIILCKRIFQGGDEFSPRGELVIGYNLGFVGLCKLGISTQLKLVFRHLSMEGFMA